MRRIISPEKIIDILKNRELLLRQFQDEARFVFAFVKFSLTPESRDYYIDINGGINYEKMNGLTGGSGLVELVETIEKTEHERKRQFNDTVMAFQKCHDNYVLIGDVMKAYMSLETEEKEVLSKLYMEGLSLPEAQATLERTLHISVPTIYRIRARAMDKLIELLSPPEKEEERPAEELLLDEN